MLHKIFLFSLFCQCLCLQYIFVVALEKSSSFGKASEFHNLFSFSQCFFFFFQIMKSFHFFFSFVFVFNKDMFYCCYCCCFCCCCCFILSCQTDNVINVFKLTFFAWVYFCGLSQFNFRNKYKNVI